MQKQLLLCRTERDCEIKPNFKQKQNAAEQNSSGLALATGTPPWTRQVVMELIGGATDGVLPGHDLTDR
jgi:hypothetical protein